MAVPAAASGHTKRSRRLAGAKLSSRRSPQRVADASRKCRWGPSSRHLCSLSRRGSSLPARRRHCYSLTPGHRGQLRSTRLLPERARFLPDRSEVPAPSVLTESQQTSCGANRWQGLPCPRPGSPPSGTPSADPENKAQRSAQVGEQDPADRPLPELTLCTMGPSSSPAVASKGARAPSLFLRLFASRFACYLHIWSELPFLFPPCTFFFHPNTTGPLRGPAAQKHQAVTFFFLLPLTEQRVSELGCLAQPASLLLFCVQWGG